MFYFISLLLKIGDGLDLLDDGGKRLSIAGRSSKMTVAQKCPGAIKFKSMTNLLMDQRTDMGRC